MALAVALVAGALIVALAWPARRARPRYCGGRCIRLAGHPGAHVDETGRSWP